MEKLILIDGNSLLNRAYYATPVFSTRSGMPTNAIFGFVKLLFKILDGEKPEYIAVAFDLKAPTFRHKMYDGYKATRKGMPDDLAAQVEPLKNLLSAMKIATCCKEGIEADDIIGSLTRKFDVHSYIYTGDRDSFQLVNANTDVYYTKRGVSDLLKLNIDNFKAQTGINPSQIIDLKALMGDKSDNIPGVPGIGEKTAYDLLGKYSTLDGVYENIENLKGATKDKLINNKELAYLSYSLATIDTDCKVDLLLENCVAPKKYSSDVKKIFTQLEFNSLLSLDIFEDGACVEAEQRAYPENIICDNVNELLEAIKCNYVFGVIVEQASAKIYVGGKHYSVGVQNDLIEAGISVNDYIKALRAVFSVKNNKVITFGYKAAMHILNSYGIELLCDFEDVALQKYLCDFTTASMNFQELCGYYLYDYGYAAFAVYELSERYFKLLKSENMLELYEKIEKPLLPVLYDMEKTGVKVSRETLDSLAERYDKICNEYKSKIFEACGKQFNLNSPAQLGEVLYKNIGITAVKKKKSDKYITSADVLDKLRLEYPIVDDVLKYRMYQKLNSTYLEGFKPLINRTTDLIHTTYNQALTTTGRLSSEKPNLQNIPIRENEGREIRKIFIPREGNIFIDADYSQIELRLLAHFSDCAELIEAYRKGIDIHSVTASQVFGVQLGDVTEKMRREAKAVNFGIIYGLSDFGLSKNLNISLETARQYINKYFETYREVKEYMNANVEFAKEHGYIATLTGRKRVIPEIKSPNYNLRQFGERAAMNMPLQGSSADIIKIAMINVYNKLQEADLKTKLILQVHDELVLDAPEEEADIASEILKTEMENAVKLKVPLTVEVHCGRNWYAAK